MSTSLEKLALYQDILHSPAYVGLDWQGPLFIAMIDDDNKVINSIELPSEKLVVHKLIDGAYEVEVYIDSTKQESKRRVDFPVVTKNVKQVDLYLYDAKGARITHVPVASAEDWQSTASRSSVQGTSVSVRLPEAIRLSPVEVAELPF